MKINNTIQILLNKPRNSVTKKVLFLRFVVSLDKLFSINFLSVKLLWIDILAL